MAAPTTHRFRRHRGLLSGAGVSLLHCPRCAWTVPPPPGAYPAGTRPELLGSGDSGLRRGRPRIDGPHVLVWHPEHLGSGAARVACQQRIRILVVLARSLFPMT